MVDISQEELAAATARGDELMRGARAQTVHYDRDRDRIVIQLTTGVEVSFAPGDAQGLEAATATDLDAVQVDAFGLGIHFPSLDADLYIPAILEGRLGSDTWMSGRRVVAASTTPGAEGSLSERRRDAGSGAVATQRVSRDEMQG